MIKLNQANKVYKYGIFSSGYLHLKVIKCLSVDPELSPFEDQGLQLSGAEEAANLLRVSPKKIN